MHQFIFIVLLNFSIVLPALASLIRFRFITESFQPFIFLIWLGLINEVLSLALIYNVRSNTINSNIYVLAEFVLILLMFFNWNNKPKKKYLIFAAIGFIVWFADNALINSIDKSNSIFRIFYSFIVVFLSIDQISKVIINERGSLLKNTIFLVCIAFLLYYGCKAFIEVFNAFDLGFSNMFNRNMFMILYVANLFSNIIYAIAILCIPTKQEFSLQY